MLEDRVLVWRMRRGSTEALCRIYEKYRDDLLRLAVSLASEISMAEDVVHDVFVSFIGSAGQFRLRGSLKGYLVTCVANRMRNANRDRRRSHASADEARELVCESRRPDQWVACSEELEQIVGALALLPYEQREAVTLRLQGAMKFREIAQLQQVPVKTALSRYRCGLQKIRSLLNGDTTQCDR